MATKAQTDDEKVESQKTITVVAYLNERNQNLREWADAVDDRHDYFEKETEKAYTFSLGPIEGRRLSEKEYEELKGSDIGDGELKVTTSTNFKYNPDNVPRKVVDDFLQEFDIPEGYEEFIGRIRIEGGGDTVINTYSKAKKMGLIKHPSEMDGEDPWEDKDADLAAMRFKISVYDVQKSHVKELSDTYLKEFVEYLNTLDYTGRIRWFDCETKKVEKGECFNV